jgi:hypothetical protein
VGYIKPALTIFERMKKVKYILFSLMMLFSMSQIEGHDIFKYIGHIKSHNENQDIPAEPSSTVSSEASAEEENPVFLNSYNPVPVKFTLEKLQVEAFLLPPQIYYSIWLPPDRC